MINQKGDTDTNSCIVGGMIGCLVGYDKIPQKLRNPMLVFGDPYMGDGHKRPEWLYPGLHIETLIRSIAKAAPSQLTIEED